MVQVSSPAEVLEFATRCDIAQEIAFASVRTREVLHVSHYETSTWTKKLHNEAVREVTYINQDVSATLEPTILKQEQSDSHLVIQ